MADFKGRKRGKSHVQTMGIFLVAQDMVLSHRAKFQPIIDFFGVKAISTELFLGCIQQIKMLYKSALEEKIVNKVDFV